MPLINQALPNLIGGVSQQPDVTRFEGQCEEQENALSSVVDGLSKRPHTKHIAQILNNAIGIKSFVHFINRSIDEKYVFIHDGSKMRAFNIISGVECTINNSYTQNNSLKYQTTGNYGYLGTGNPKRDLRALTVGDNTFILNTEKIVGQDDTASGLLPKNALLYIKQGGYNKRYKVNINRTVHSNSNASNVSLTGTTWVITHQSYSPAGTGSITVSLQDITFTGGTSYKDNVDVLTTLKSTVAGGTVRNGTKRSSNTNPQVRWTTASNGALVATVVAGGSWNITGTVTGAANTEDGLYNLLITELDNYWGDGANLEFNPEEPRLVNENNLTGEDEVSGAITTGSSSGDSTSARNAGTAKIMADLLASNSSDIANNFNVSSNGHVALLKAKTTNGSNMNVHPTGVDFTITTEDDLGGEGIEAIYKSTDSISSLPAFSANGFKVKVSGDGETGADDYYVQFETSSGANFGLGSYVETIGNKMRTTLKASTLPHKLVLTGLNTFVLKACEFETRKVGDDDSNPFPSFLNNKISGIFFFKDRLGFLCNDNVIMSEAGLGITEGNETKFNFFRTTVQTSLDSDPIDIAVSSNRVTQLKEAVGFQENLILFSDNAQFVLKGGDLLTPSSVSVVPITNFEFDQNIKPLSLGSYVYFSFSRNDYAGIREFTVNSTTDNYDASEITEHVPAYIPKDIELLKGSTAEDVIIATATSEPTNLYVYKYFWSGNQKLLSSWSVFKFPFHIRGADIFEGTLYLIGAKYYKTHIISMPLQAGIKDTGMNYNTHLDMRKEHDLSNSKMISLGFTTSPNDPVQVWDDEGNLLYDTKYNFSLNTVTLSSNHTGRVFSGLAYTMKYVFSEQVFKQPAGTSKAPSGFTKAQIRNGAVFFNETRGFTVKVKPDNRPEATHTYTPTVIGTSSIGNIDLPSGNFRFPVFTDAEGTTIKIENSSALPANFSSAEFEMFVHERSRRFG